MCVCIHTFPYPLALQALVLIVLGEGLEHFLQSRTDDITGVPGTASVEQAEIGANHDLSPSPSFFFPRSPSSHPSLPPSSSLALPRRSPT